MHKESSEPFAFLNTNLRSPKPRKRGVTEIRGPYYSPMGPQYLTDLLDSVGKYIDSLKFAGGSFAIINPDSVSELIEIAHKHEVEVSTGGFMEYVLTRGYQAVEQYLDACKFMGFDTVELSCGFITMPTDDWSRLIDDVHNKDMKAKPELGIQFGAGGDTALGELELEGTQNVEIIIKQASRFLEQGVQQLMIESEGITENVRSWRTDVISSLINELGLENLMFEAADPAVFSWYVKNYGPDVNLFVDHSQIIQLETLRQGIWGTKSLWGRVVTYKPDLAKQIEESKSPAPLASL